MTALVEAVLGIFTANQELSGDRRVRCAGVAFAQGEQVRLPHIAGTEGAGYHETMLVCVDVGYRDGRALAACVLFAHWRAAEALRVVRATVDDVAAYEPGQFYKRELPAVLGALAQCPAPPSAVVIDGYAWLGDGGLPGLGARLFEALERRSPVIGVAKTRFADDRCSVPVFRGSSKRPLFVTAAGLPPGEAAAAIQSMHGLNRVPTLLKLADAACRL